MMVLQAIAQDKAMLQDIAQDLLIEKLIAHAVISKKMVFQTVDDIGNVISIEKYILKGLSKSLLFSRINDRLREQYGHKIPILYSEPVIMIDPLQADEIIEKLVSV